MVRWLAGTSGRGGAADEQGDFAAGDVVAGDEVEDAVLFLDIDAVALQHAAGGGEELRRRDGFHQPQGDEIGLALQVGIDGEGHAELVAEDFVDEGDQGDVVEAQGDGVAGEALAQAVGDAFGDGFLHDHAGWPGDAELRSGFFGDFRG